MNSAKGKEPKYLISAIARLLNVHPQTLRTYERLELIRPSRTDGNTRLYSEDDVENIKKILTLTRDMGVNLAGVEIIERMRRRLMNTQVHYYKMISFVRQEMHQMNPDAAECFEKILLQLNEIDLFDENTHFLDSDEFPKTE